jgi:hypothetical protein
MTDPQIVSVISRFFFFVFLDEKLATVSATKALHDWRHLMTRSAAQNRFAVINAVKVMSQAFLALKNMPQTGQPIVFSDKDWSIPSRVELGTWLDFRRQASTDEFLAVLLLQVLKLPPQLVAEALRTTIGALDYRLSKGLRRLGHLRLGSEHLL